LTKISNNSPNKVVFNELSKFKTQNAESPYLSYILTLFEDVGLPHFIEGNFKINTFNRFFGMNNTIKEREIIETKTTFETYGVGDLREKNRLLGSQKLDIQA
jgi:hypothetical protein